MYLNLSPQAKESKGKINKWDLINLSLLQIKGNFWQNKTNKKTTDEMGENIAYDMANKG